MLFESTRGGDKAKTFEEVLLKGLADDGGLYIPTEWPKADIRKLQECNSFIDIAKLIVPLFTESSYKKEEVITLLENTWHDFEKSDLVGIKEVSEDIFIGELFHGPTAAFKDFGLQLCAAFFNKALEKNNQTAIILGATSGDTGLLNQLLKTNLF
jgi:threonine synthase